MDTATVGTLDRLERCFYSIEEHGGKKYVHYLTDIAENGDYPDSVDEDGSYEEFDNYEGTSYDITDYTFLYFEVGTWSGMDEFFELFRREAPLVQQYLGRVYDTEAAKYVSDVLGHGDCAEHAVWDVDEGVALGNYWC